MALPFEASFAAPLAGSRIGRQQSAAQPITIIWSSFVRRVTEVIVVLHVLTSLFFLASCSGTLVSRAQVCRTAGFRTNCTKRHQTLHLLDTAGRTCDRSATGSLKMLKVLLTLKALILKNGH